MAGVTLQINVAPTDLPYARVTLPHQLRRLGAQVDEILFTLDERTPPPRSRFAQSWEASRAGMDAVLAELCAAEPKARVDGVAYTGPVAEAVALRFFGEPAMPDKDSRGGPFRAYFHGLHSARHDVVLHADADMLFGGGAPGWVGEAAALLAADERMLVTSPLAGPPRADGTVGYPAEPVAGLPGPAFRFTTVSTRVFMVDRRRLDALLPLDLHRRPPLAKLAKAVVQGNPRTMPPELLLGQAMHAAGRYRVDALGTAPGMWSLHPPYRSPDFLAAFPALADRVERGDIPDAQRGDYDLNDSMFPWADEPLGFQIRRRLGF